jgi:hypothetical protein
MLNVTLEPDACGNTTLETDLNAFDPVVAVLCVLVIAKFSLIAFPKILRPLTTAVPAATFEVVPVGVKVTFLGKSGCAEKVEMVVAATELIAAPDLSRLELAAIGFTI